MANLDPRYLALHIPAILIAITVHEFSHARVALAFGDDTAEREGRVSLNPLVHLDPIGTIGLLFGFFGWGKPVPVNSHMLKHPRADFFVSAAGPASNLALATIASLVYHLADAPGAPVGTGGLSFLVHFIYLNLGLALFNLIPLFPLDGSHMLENLLPLEQAYRFRQFSASFGMPILFGSILLGAATGVSPLGIVIGPPMEWISHVLLRSWW